MRGTTRLFITSLLASAISISGTFAAADPAAPASGAQAVGAVSAAATAQPPVAIPATAPAAQPADATTATTPAAGTVASPATPPPAPKVPTLIQKPGELTLGFEGLDLAGNRNKFYQYATPPEGFFIDKLRYAPFSSQGNLGTILLQTPGDVDYRDSARVALFGGKTIVDGLSMNNRFYDTTPQVISPSDRSIQQFYLQQTIADRFKISTRYEEDQQDQYFEPPNDPLHQRTRYNDVAAAGVAGGGYLNVTYSDQRYTDRTEVINNTDVKQYLVTYLHDVGKSQSVEAKADVQNVAVAGAPDGHITAATLADSVNINATTDASLALYKLSVSAPIIENDYVQEQQSATARLSKVWNNWNGTLAYQSLTDQYVNSDHTYVNTPRWQTCEGRIRGKLGDTWSVMANGYTQVLTGAPQSSTTDPDSLLWSDREYSNVQINAVTDLLSGSISWTIDRKNNDQRTTTITSNTVNFDGNWQASPEVNMFADYTVQRWAANNGLLAGLPLDEFAPNTDVLDVGMNWVLGAQTYVNADFSGFWDGNDNPLLLADANTNGKFLTLQLHQEFSGGREAGLIVSPWVYRDSVVSQEDYDASVFEVTLSTPF